MTEAQALQIIVERRGLMYDPEVVDAFVAAHQRIMPAADSLPHPVAVAIGEARSQDREEDRVEAAAASSPSDGGFADGLLAITSLSRALGGDARLSDVGALLWMIFGRIVPSDAMAIFLPDEDRDEVVVRYAAGTQASAIARVGRPSGAGIAGWVAANRRAAVNADPSLDLGAGVVKGPHALRSCLALPLIDGDTVVAVLALYGQGASAFTSDHVRLLELLAPRLAAALARATAKDETLEHAPVPVAALKLIKGA